MISHVSLGARDLALSTRFYDACLAALGYVRLYSSARVSGYGHPGTEASLDVFPIRADEPRRALAGFHVAFEAASDAAVQAFHTAALAVGGTDAGPPGLRPQYGEHYFAAFVLDPDGHRIEAVHQPAKG